jgi:hypothetical protein
MPFLIRLFDFDPIQLVWMVNEVRKLWAIEKQ